MQEYYGNFGKEGYFRRLKCYILRRNMLRLYYSSSRRKAKGYPFDG